MPKCCHEGKAVRRLFHHLLPVCCRGRSRHVTRGTWIARAAQQNCILPSCKPRVGTRKFMNFASDNTAGIAAPILEAIGKANTGYAWGYGNDDWTKRVEKKLADIFEHEVAVFMV